MLTFEGKAASFQPGKEVVNKEPPTNKFVVEKLYAVHRKRMQKMEPVVDCHVDIPDFLTNTSWKQITEQHRREVITKQNEVIYKRIAKAENTESLITTENRAHIKRVEHELLLMKRLKQMGRIRDILKVQRENEELLTRIERSRPAYGAKSIRDWYKHHEMFKDGRRSDPVAGHLGFRGCKGLFPKALPPMPSPTQRAVDAEKASYRAGPDVFGAGYDETGRSPYKKKKSPLKLNQVPSPISRGNKELPYPASPFSPGFSVEDPLSVTLDGSESPAASPMLNNITPVKTTKRVAKKKASKNKGKTGAKQDNADAEMQKRGGNKSNEKTKKGKTRFLSGSNSNSALSGEQVATRTSSRAGTPGGYSNGGDYDEADLAVEGYKTIFSKLVGVPFTDDFIILQMLLSKSFSDVITIYCRRTEAPYEIISTKETPIDKIDELVRAHGTSSIFSDSAIISDIATMRETFNKMFHEVDDDGNGYLTFDEFMVLMKKTKLGIEQHDLRKILIEADDNGNGVVEFEEFYPLILDMTLSFRTINAAREIVAKREQIIDEEVKRKMLKINFEESSEQLQLKISGCDPKNTGVVRYADLKRCLIALAGPLKLTEYEISKIQRTLPPEGYARVSYVTIGEVFKEVKWISCKHRMEADLGTAYYKFLLSECEKISDQVDHADKGMIKISQLSDILQNEEAFELNTIQRIVLMGEATKFISSDEESVDTLHIGAMDVDFHRILPVIAKGIELMLDPDMLRQRAELLNPEMEGLDMASLAADLNDNKANKKKGLGAIKDTDARLKGLFNMTDVNKDNSMSEKEFIYCIQAVKLGLNEDEIKALFVQADKNCTGSLSYADFAYFFEQNLAAIERANHMKALYSSLHENSATIKAVGSEAEQLKQLKDLEEHLCYVFNTIDTEKAGKLEKNDLEHVLNQIDVELTSFQMSTILNEMFTDEQGFVDIQQAVTITANLLQTFLADENSKNIEERAEQEAARVVKYMERDIHRVALFFLRGIHDIDAGHGKLLSEEDRNRQLELLVHSQYSGLAPTEANHIMHTLFNESYRSKMKNTNKIIDARKFDEENLEENSKRMIRRRTTVRKSKAFQSKGKSDDSKSMAIDSIPSEPNVTTSSQTYSPRVNEADIASEEQGKIRGRTARSTLLVLPNNGKENMHAGLSNLRRKTVIARAKWTPTEQELTDAIVRAKQETIMRARIQQLNKTNTSKAILSAFENAKEVLIMRGKVEPDEKYLPVHIAYATLSDGWHFRLNHSQIMAMINFSNCFDRTETMFDYAKFADYAGDAIRAFHDPALIEKRAYVIELIAADSTRNHKENAKQSLEFGALTISESELDDYLLPAFLSAEDARGEVSQKEFIRILMNIPGVVFTTKDACVVAAGFPHTQHGDSVHWQKFVPWAYNSISSLCLEHMIRRRMTLLDIDKVGAIANEEINRKHNESGGELSAALEEMRSLAVNASELLKIRHVAGKNEDGEPIEETILALFPFDIDENIEAEQGDLVEEENVASLDSLSIDQGEDGSCTELYGADGIFIDALIVHPPTPQTGKPNRSSGINMEMPKAQTTPQKRRGTPSVDARKIDPVKVNISVVANENSHSIERELNVFVGGSFAYNTSYPYSKSSKECRDFLISIEQSIAMPSMCLIDPDATIEFAATLPEKLVIEFTEGGSEQPRLMLKPTNHS